MSQTDLSALLGQEVSMVEKLIDILKLEKEALIKREFEKLEKFSEQKQELSEKLEASAQMRVALFSDKTAPEEYRDALKKHMANCPAAEVDKINLLNQKLAEKLIECREQNLVNGQVISANINTRQEILHALTSHTTSQSSKTYNQDGVLKNNGSSGRHEQA